MAKLHYKAVKINGKKYDVHRLIMQQKLGRKIPKGKVVHHIDGNIHNNHPDNLKLQSRSAHSRYHGKGRPATQTMKEKCTETGQMFLNGAKLFTSDVLEIRRMHKGGMTQTEIAALFGVNKSTISEVVNRVTFYWI